MERRTIIVCCVSWARSRSLISFSFSLYSTGIGALVGAYVNHQKAGRSLALVGVRQRVRDAMQVTRVEQFFRFYDTEAAALEA